MKITEVFNGNTSDISWVCISASAMMVGNIAVQFDVADNGILLTVEKSGDGSGFDEAEKKYTEFTIQDVLAALQNSDVEVIKDEDEDTSYRFEDDSDSDGSSEYNISCGNDDEIFASISGWDFECESLKTIIQALASDFAELKEVRDFINGEYNTYE